ncbi:hypothetical protein J7M28_12505 [bacterium]|nr:hypothetical protein [bacterium]
MSSNSLRDFPEDPALQEIHFARLKIHEATRGMSDEEFVQFIKAQANKARLAAHKC